MEQIHTHWAKTVQSSPDVIEMAFIPITALLDGVHGKEHLTRAINLYLECKVNFWVVLVSCSNRIWIEAHSFDIPF